MLKKDYARYDKEESLGDLDHDLGDEYGWKQVHGDVFRAPRSLLLFSALVGTGHQLVWLTLVIILYTIIGNLYAE
jgi:transmembrane 9 superfamily protein 3